MPGVEESDLDGPMQRHASEDERIRTRAYHLWEQAGRPVGRDDEFWQRARDAERAENTVDDGGGAIAMQPTGARTWTS
jgi:hypothetical protein